MGILVDILIVLSVPSLIMKVQQVLTIMSFDNQLNCCSAPNVFCVVDIYFVSWLHRLHLMTSNPVSILFHSLLPALELFGLSLIFFRENNHFDRIINHQGELENFSPNIFAALWAFLSTNQALGNALVAERVTTDGNPTGNNQVHADGASESLNLFERLETCLLLLVHNSPKIVSFLVLLLSLGGLWLRLFNLLILDLLRLLTSSQNLGPESVLNRLDFLDLLQLILFNLKF